MGAGRAENTASSFGRRCIGFGALAAPVFLHHQKHKKARNALAAVLKRMGWYQFQKSVFVHPFECENEINFVVRFFNIEPYVSLIKTEDIDRETELRAHFKSLMLN